jgi:hypothetical protein
MRGKVSIAGVRVPVGTMCCSINWEGLHLGQCSIDWQLSRAHTATLGMPAVWTGMSESCTADTCTLPCAQCVTCVDACMRYSG